MTDIATTGCGITPRLTEAENCTSLWLKKFENDSLKKEAFPMNPTDTNRPDLLCLSHLRWDFVFQRPQHLMRRFAQHRRVLFIEEAIFESGDGMRLNVRTCPRTNVQVITPHLPERFRAAHNSIVSDLLSAHLEKENVYN